jgi:hypothetical protein
MAQWPFYSPSSGWHVNARGTTTAISPAVTVTPVVASKGSWVSIDGAAVAEDSAGFWVSWGTGLTTSATARNSLLDFGLSVDGTTFWPVIENIDFGGRFKGGLDATAPWHDPLFVPCRIKSGWRIGCRSRANVTTTFTMAAYPVALGGINGPLMMPGYCHPHTTADAHPDTYGAVVATSKGTAVTPSATINTYGTAVTFTSSTANAYRGVIIGIGGNGETASTACHHQLKIDDGTTVLSDGIVTSRTLAEEIIVEFPRAQFVPFPSTLKAGSTLRVTCSSSKASMTALTVTLHGVR